MSVQDNLNKLEIELGEWKEELGERFPSFLNYVLMSRLLQAQEKIEYLKKVSFYEIQRK